VLLPPARRMRPGGHIAPGGDATQHEHRGATRSTEAAETHHAGPEQSPAREGQSALEPHLKRDAGRDAHALTGRSRSKPGSPTVVPAGRSTGAR
jgi:hypothetical protein